MPEVLWVESIIEVNNMFEPMHLLLLMMFVGCATSFFLICRFLWRKGSTK